MNILIGMDKEPCMVNRIGRYQVQNLYSCSNFFMIHLQTVDVDIYVNKDTKEWHEIFSMVNYKYADEDDIEVKGIELLLKYITPDEFFEMIMDEDSKSFKEGYEKAQKNIRHALGIVE